MFDIECMKNCVSAYGRCSDMCPCIHTEGSIFVYKIQIIIIQFIFFQELILLTYIYLESTHLTIGECDAKWSSWNDRDNASGTGDWELIHLRADYSNLCAAPAAAQARIVGTGETHTTQNVEFGVNGLVCKNADQQGELCLDYEVRFCCPGT